MTERPGRTERDRRGLLVRGFTLIELLIVVAIIGIIAALLIPNLLDALQKAKQKRTVSDMRTVGGAWFSWYTDQISAAAAGAPQAEIPWPLPDTQAFDREALIDLLRPSTTMMYLQRVPETDGWRTPYEYVITEDMSDPQVLMMRFGNIMAMRSLGRDQTENSPYQPGSFITTDYDQDIVWADGYLVRFPGTVSPTSP